MSNISHTERLSNLQKKLSLIEEMIRSEFPDKHLHLIKSRDGIAIALNGGRGPTLRVSERYGLWITKLLHASDDTSHTTDQKVDHLRDALRLGELGLRIERGDIPCGPAITVWEHIMEVDHV